MCGIAGILNYGSRKTMELSKNGAMANMLGSMVHRGPDYQAWREFPPVHLGMCRLSIIDLNARAHQPMPNEDGSIWVVFNGEIYGYREQRDLLKSKGHKFRSSADTEVLVHLYEEFGCECIHRLRGMFAFAIWDIRKKLLFIARDRLGIKPLYIYHSANVFLFASELKALLASDLVDREPNLQAVDYYLSFGSVPAPYTLFKGIEALPPGQAIQIRPLDSTRRIYCYWKLPEEGSTHCEEKKIVPKIRDLVEESIRLHQVSDVPIGAFLSGGIDSTLLVALMSRILEKPVQTISIGFENVQEHFNELNYARFASEIYHTDHTEVLISGNDVVNALDDFVWYLDSPSIDGLNSYFVCRVARTAGLTVALSGLGGDELFGGYRPYSFVQKWGWLATSWGNLPSPLHNFVHLSGRLFQRATRNYWFNGRFHKLSHLRYVDSPESLYAMFHVLLWTHERQSLYKSGGHALHNNGSSAEIELLKSYCEQDDSIWQMVTRLTMRNYMAHRLLRDTDVMSMAHSVEVRVPLIDNELVEFVAGLSTPLKHKAKTPKYLLTSAFSDLLPSEIVFRKKHGFDFPLNKWMRNELRPVVEEVFSVESICRRGLFDPIQLRLLYKEYQKGLRTYHVIWQFVVLELWMRKYMDDFNNELRTKLLEHPSSSYSKT